MIVLSALHDLLLQILSLPELHTAILLSPEGQLISVASNPAHSKDDARVVAGLSAQAWNESQEPGHGQSDGEVLMDSEVCLLLLLV